jgi:hypothetical protein
MPALRVSQELLLALGLGCCCICALCLCCLGPSLLHHTAQKVGELACVKTQQNMRHAQVDVYQQCHELDSQRP